MPAGKRDGTADITQLYSRAQKDTNMVDDCWILIMRKVDWTKDTRQLRKRRRAEEEQGGYNCGMCDE